MRFLHAADLHLDSPIRSLAMRNPALQDRVRLASRDVLGRIVDLAIDEQVGALVLAGDIFDNGVPDMAARAVFLTQIARAARHGVPTVLIRGNHDALLDHTRHGALGDDIHLLDRDRPTVSIGGVAFHGLSFEAAHMARSMLPDYPAPVAGGANVGLMHTSLGGAEGHDPYAPCGEAELLAHGYDYWALGHIHKRFERRGAGALAVMPGIPQGRHVGEAGRGSVTLVTVDGDGARAEERPVATLAFQGATADLGAASSQQAQVEALREVLSAACVPDCETALRLRLRGADLSASDARDLAAQLAEEIPHLYVEKVLIDTTARPDIAAPGAADLASLMQDEARKPGFRTEAEGVLSELRAALPRDAQDALADDDLDALIRDGLDAVRRQLGGADQ